MSFSSVFFDMAEFEGKLTHREWQILMPPSSRTDLGGLQNELRERQQRMAADTDAKKPEVGTKVELQGSVKSPAMDGQIGTVPGARARL